jgi:3-phenylpropionate/trans-cinnamate dioxygenase ferredoxin component
MAEPPNHKDREQEIKEPKPFGVDYVPYVKRAIPKKGEPVFVGKVSEIPPGKAKSVMTEKFRVAVFNVDGNFYAIKDACPHAEYPLEKGTLRGEVVACSSHNWQFNVRTGECIRGDEGVTIRRFEVEVRGDEVWVKA